MGPQHPSTHGVLRVVLRTDGELVLDAVPHIGYLHRCAEKIGENVTARQWIPYTDRMDYLAGMNMNLGWSLAVEKLLGLEVTEKARHLRVLIAELGRIASHLVAAGTYGLDLGSFTPFMYCFREREKILNLFEAVCGARLTYSYITIGGLMADLPPGWLEECEAFLDQFDPVIDDLHDLLSTNAVFIKRTAGVGVLSAEEALDYGCTGPVLRGSGVDWDLRRDGDPFYTRMYEGYDFETAVCRQGSYPQNPPCPDVPREAVLGDCWHRFFVRMVEVAQSIRLVRQAIDRYRKAEGDIGRPIKLTDKLPPGEVYLETECPKGQMGFLVVGQGEAVPWRARARSGSFCNLSALRQMCRNCLIADVPAVVGSLDIVLGEVDR
ncbi:MAG: NADH-quinone oxidoreductase subunit D [Thermogutta sp.]|nr:NADH-quinone oxidoreductase subunit D [Thermogutta sp.]